MNPDIEYLRELKQRFEEYRERNEVQGDIIAKMIDDWIDEMEEVK